MTDFTWERCSVELLAPNLVQMSQKITPVTIMRSVLSETCVFDVCWRIRIFVQTMCFSLYGSFYFVGDPQLPLPNLRWLRPECDFAIVWPSKERSSRRLEGGKGGSGWILCDNPIGEDDTGGSAVWVLYREWPYQRKMTRNLGWNNAKNRGRCQILHEWGVPWSFWLETWFRWVKKLRRWRLWGTFRAKHLFLTCFEGFGFLYKSGLFFSDILGVSDTE